MSMLSYIAKRLLVLVPVLFGVLTMTFILSKLMPGDPAYALLPLNHTHEQYVAMRRFLGLDDPILIQYFRYLADLFSGNWGASFAINRGIPVWDLIWDRFPRTIELTIFSVLIASYLGIKTGIIASRHRNKWQDTTFRGFALLGVSIPVFWLGMMLQYVFAYQLDWLPSGGFKDSDYGNPAFVTGFRLIDSLLSGEFYLAVDYLIHLIMPVMCLAFITLASITRQTRSSMLEVLQQDYIRTARAKGCKEKDVLHTHALKNALIPTVTIIGLNFGGLLGGAILTETTFTMAGMGELLVSAIQERDIYLINGMVFFAALLFVIINLFIDVLYGIIDPRIRY
ncbi:MAG: ABC transporter permease [Candidatus Hodarchaeota archaeon]